ncbi:MAG: glycosyltransferase [bacterium]|nr:glycosyltransferase [bacterium]
MSDCLLSILAADPLADTVLFTDDHSEDRTRDIAARIAAADSRLLIRSNPAPHHQASPKKGALANAFNELSTDWIAVTDADCQVPTAWLGSLRAAASPHTGAVIGASWPHYRAGFTHRAYRWERLIANVSMASACGWGHVSSACGHSILYARRALLTVNAPVRRDLPSGDDDLTVQAMARAGFDVSFCADPASVVREAGARGSRTGQASRHQSVVRYYPTRWRLLYSWSAFSGLAAPVGIALASSGHLPAIIGVGSVAKLATDWLTGFIFARQMKLDITAFDIFCGALMLPFWIIWRTFAFLLPSHYSWRGRKFQSMAPTLAAHKR